MSSSTDCEIMMTKNIALYCNITSMYLILISVRRRQKKHRLVVEVESLASSSKKNIKSRQTLNKNSCDLLTAITHAKILVAYFIISE